MNAPAVIIRRVEGPATGNGAARPGEVLPSPPASHLNPSAPDPGAVASAAAPFHPRRGLTEADLIRGYSGGPGPLVEPCACGSVIVCISSDIASGVAAHNATPRHRAWSDAGGLGEGPSFEVRVLRRADP